MRKGHVYLPYIRPLFHNLSKFLIQALQLAELIRLCATIKKKIQIKAVLYTIGYICILSTTGMELARNGG